MQAALCLDTLDNTMIMSYGARCCFSVQLARISAYHTKKIYVAVAI